MRTSELTGPALDWAVNQIEECCDDPATPLFSTNWSQGGPIIEREKLDVMWCGDRWCAYAMTPDKETQLVDEGPTPLVAAMRCYVASRLGDTIDVREELP